MDRTIKGVNVSVDPRAFTDMRTVRFIRDIIKAENKQKEGKEFSPEDVLKFTDLFEFLLGEEQANRVIKELQDEDGFTSTEVIYAFLGELLASQKNS